ncbi:hypothetical protein [Salinibacterium sp. SWN1162]|uniref:hypothetical protein n=1 Tax=Salinibacterium sp. SWN1162 TaxID=2792053 RepID=UPI0018CDD787|nr:hypothetical protein [Salinibacterium sp. SWN1162]MBH0008703.1 hypothetical protein [Salinibacterium sp. SWN1162]
MFSLGLPVLVATDTADVVRGTTIAVATVVVLVLAVGVVAFVTLFRRGGDRGIRGTASQSALESRAAGLLVALDDRVREADLELGFAVAQFGADAACDFASALAEARGQLTEAFRLGQQRDDAAGARQLAAAEELYDDDVLTVPRRELAAGRSEIAAAETALDAAAANISPTGVNAVTDTLRGAATALHRAERAAEVTDQAFAELAEAAAAVLQLREATHSDLLEARLAAESAPDPQSGARILTAIAASERALERTVATSSNLHSPLEQLALLNDARTELDSALATARNQQQRFEHARAAYQGTLVAARSQISVVRELVGRGGASARARTRLAEAERQLMIAEAETDPVEALDAIRRSVTHARDADALARY